MWPVCSRPICADTVVPIPGRVHNSMSVLGDDCRGFLDTLGITRPAVLGGLSMGGYVAFEFYRKYPQRIAGLILVATHAGVDSPEAKANRDKAAMTAREKGVGAIVET